MERMSTLDAGFYFIEHENTPMHVGSVLLFEGPPPSYGDLVRLLAGKLHKVPRYRQRVRTVPLHLGRPAWVDDEHFEILYHVRHTAVPTPGGTEQLRNLAGRVFAQRLDMAKPLWELWLVEGLQDNRWAAISKVHHCMIDGMAGWDLAAMLLDLTPDAEHPAVPDGWSARPAPSRSELIAGGGELVEGQMVRSLVPVSVRSREEKGLLNNRVSGVLVNLPVGETDPVKRLELLREQMDDVKNSQQAIGAQALTELAGFAAPTLLALGTRVAMRFPQPVMQTATTNVPGPRFPLHLLGRRMVEVHPYVPIAVRMLTAIGIFSYLDQLNFGITGDFDAVPDIGVLAAGIRAGVDELLDRVATPAQPVPVKKAKKVPAKKVAKSAVKRPATAAPDG